MCYKSQQQVVGVYKKCALLNTVHVQYLQGCMVHSDNLNS